MKKKGKQQGKLMSRLANGAFVDTWKRVKGRKKTLFLTMLLDVCFLLTLILFNILMTRIFPNPQQQMANASMTLITVALIIIVYLFIVVMAYSFFKFLVINQVKLFFAKNKTDFERFGSFLWPNMIMIAIFFAAFLVFSLLFVTTIKLFALALVRNVFFVVMGLLLYLLMNTMHSLSMQKKRGVRALLGGTADIVFNRLKIYVGLIVFTIIAFFLLVGVYYLFDFVVLKILGSAMTTRAVYLGYAAVNTLVVAVLALGLVAFNRVYFYSVVLRNG